MSGFSVFQPTLGAALQWLPALGSAELDEMIHAVIPGSASTQDKRAHISMDFFEYSRQTGENFKHYAVHASFAYPTTSSPASSAPLHDSGYGSNFDVSPVISDMSPWTQSPAAFTPSFDETRTQSHPAPSRRSTASSSRQPTTTDFSSHPGMRIMTKDGRDVTNSASRGCKTKEQRDHAHLMRIIKACDACKRKKIRCDPSHKKRTASQASSSSQQESKPAKKPKKVAESPPIDLGLMPDFFVPNFFETPEATSSSFEESPENVDELWNQFVLFDQEPATLATDTQYSTQYNDYDFFNDPQGLPTPSSSDSSASPSQWFAPYTPQPPGPSPVVIASELDAFPSPQDPTVPYLNPGVAHGTNYVDFNLYSSPTDFFLDEEPLPSKKAMMSGGSQRQSPQQNHTDFAGDLFQRNTLQETVFAASTDEYCSSPSSFQSTPSSSSGGALSGARPLDEYGHVSVPTAASLVHHGFIAADQSYDGHDDPGLGSRPQQRGSQQGGSIMTSRTSNGNGNVEVHVTCQTLTATISPLSTGPFVHAEVFSSLGLPTRGFPPRRVSSVTSEPAAGDQTVNRRQSESIAPSLSTTYLPDIQSTATTSFATPGRSAYGRLLSEGKGIQTLSAHAAAPQGSDEPAGQTWRPSLSSSSAATVHEQHSRATLATQLAEPRLEPYCVPRAETASFQDAGIPALNAVLATILISISPMRPILSGYIAKNGQRAVMQSATFQLVVFGLVSSLLACAMQSQLPGAGVDLKVGLNVLIIISLSFASLLQHCSRLPEKASKPSGTTTSTPLSSTAMPVPVSNGTIDNVKTMIHSVSEGILDLRSTISRRLRTIVPPQFFSNALKF